MVSSDRIIHHSAMVLLNAKRRAKKDEEWYQNSEALSMDDCPLKSLTYVCMLLNVLIWTLHMSNPVQICVIRKSNCQGVFCQKRQDKGCRNRKLVSHEPKKAGVRGC